MTLWLTNSTWSWEFAVYKQKSSSILILTQYVFVELKHSEQIGRLADTVLKILQTVAFSLGGFSSVTNVAWALTGGSETAPIILD